VKIKGRPLDFSQFSIVTFDCYGTLVDWEAGIVAALQPVLQSHGLKLSDDRVLELYGEMEPRAQTGEFLPYADVLRRVMDAVADRLGFELIAGERDALVDSIGDWPVFADTPAALRSLKRRYQLWVLSNIDDSLFARTSPRLGVELDGVVTAEQLRSYKPSLTSRSCSSVRAPIRTASCTLHRACIMTLRRPVRSASRPCG
jgi:2-haloacid dehalogenase